MEGNSSGGNAAVMAVAMLFELGIAAVVIAGIWKMFTKAGQPGWAAIVPVYNYIVFARIAGREWWWGLLMLIPCVNIVVMILVMLDIAKGFGKTPGFAVGLILLAPIFMPILGFGSATYVGPPSHA